MRPARLFAAAGLALAALPAPASAWGFEGHEIVAALARARLTPAVRAKVDAILAGDADTLTAPDMEARATWADAWRGAGHRERASWHFVDLELDHPDLDAACFGRPAPGGAPASTGPARDCVVDKLDAFTRELAAAGTAPEERLLALKYVLHFVGDVHQPLHAADHQDRGGNCVRISLGGQRTSNLHAFWDTGVLEPLGPDPDAAAAALSAAITPDEARAWARGSAADWARESYGVARAVAYTLGTPAGCGREDAPTPLPAGYADRALAAARIQLERAGVRLAWVLNTALGPLPAAGPAGPPVTPVGELPLPDAPARSAASLACSAQADARGLHGIERKRFRDGCKRRSSAT